MAGARVCASPARLSLERSRVPAVGRRWVPRAERFSRRAGFEIEIDRFGGEWKTRPGQGSWFPASEGGRMRRVVVLLAGAVGLLVLPATAQASVNVAWSPQTSPDTFDFGTVDIGQTPGQTFHLTNTGSVRTPALRIKLTGSSVFKKMRDTCAGTRLAPGKSCLVRVQYTPATDGQTDSTVMTANNKTLTATYASITITGTAHGTADLVWTNTATGQPIASYDFGSTAGSHQFTLTNVGTAPAYLTSIQFSGSGGQGLSNDG